MVPAPCWKGVLEFQHPAGRKSMVPSPCWNTAYGSGMVYGLNTFFFNATLMCFSCMKMHHDLIVSRIHVVFLSCIKDTCYQHILRILKGCLFIDVQSSVIIMYVLKTSNNKTNEVQ